MKNLFILIISLITLNVYSNINNSTFKVKKTDNTKRIEIKINNSTDYTISNVYKITESNNFTFDNVYKAYYIGNSINAIYLCIYNNNAFLLVYSRDESCYYDHVKKMQIELKEKVYYIRTFNNMKYNNNCVEFIDNGVKFKYTILED